MRVGYSPMEENINITCQKKMGHDRNKIESFKEPIERGHDRGMQEGARRLVHTVICACYCIGVA